MRKHSGVFLILLFSLFFYKSTWANDSIPGVSSAEAQEALKESERAYQESAKAIRAKILGGQSAALHSSSLESAQKKKDQLREKRNQAIQEETDRLNQAQEERTAKALGNQPLDDPNGRVVSPAEVEAYQKAQPQLSGNGSGGSAHSVSNGSGSARGKTARPEWALDGKDVPAEIIYYPGKSPEKTAKKR